MPWLTPAEQETWLGFIRGSLLVLEQLDAELQAAHGLTLEDYEILANISDHEDQRMRMSDLAHSALMSKSHLTHRFDRLVRRGLVDRVKCESDLRVTYAVLTPQGLELLELAAPDHVRSVRSHLIDRLTPEQQRNLACGFAAVVEGFDPPPCPES
ncbi:MAG: Transcriptional regulator, MarR family [Actinomycetia bacterium]|nr:Transcriptional regulator, MarR family [Actinomycetes bacterium]